MPPTSDVSDEAIALLMQRYLGSCNAHIQVSALAFAKRIRDLTAARCVEVCDERYEHWCHRISPRNPDSGIGCSALEAKHCSLIIRQLFPGAAAAEGEARDGK